MSTTTQPTAAKARPEIVKRFSSSALVVTLKKWPDRPTEKGGHFLELAQDSGRRDDQGEPIWTRVQLQLADVPGALESISRAKALGIQREDAG